MQTQAISISEYLNEINYQLKNIEVKIIGEVIKSYSSSLGHYYFTLKDNKTGSVLECIAWKSVYNLYGIEITEGKELILSGHGNIYPDNGKFSFIANTIELVGEGVLKKAYDELKKKLEQQNAFDKNRKKQIPEFPHKIGLITSKQGAVIHDFTNNLSRNGFSITFIDSRVEGSEAIKSLLAAIKTLQKVDLDVIVIMRGGGSMQSMIAFDNELIVQEILNSKVPVIAAIGHHQDLPLAALVADVSVSTPTAAANLLSKKWSDAYQQLNNYKNTIFSRYKQIINDYGLTIELKQNKILESFRKIIDIFNYISKRLSSYLLIIGSNIKSTKLSVDNTYKNITENYNLQLANLNKNLDSIIINKIIGNFDNNLNSLLDKLNTKEKIIKLNNPIRILELGYSITRLNGDLVKSVRNVKIGDNIELLLKDGLVNSVVSNRTESKND